MGRFFNGKISGNKGRYFRFSPLLTLDFSDPDLRKDENARNAVFYLGDISMTINGTAYISWRNWGDYLS